MRVDSRQTPPGAEAPGRDVVDRAAAGDVSAFEALYRAHVSRVYSLACGMAGVQAAEELTQDVFVRAWQKLSLFRGESAFGTWLHRLAVNVIIERFRRDRVVRDREREDDAVLQGLVAPSTPPALRVGLAAALERLPAGARQVFVLYDVEGHTHPEIAGLLGISVGTSKTQLHRARMALRQQLTLRDGGA